MPRDTAAHIPPDRRERNPLITPAAYSHLLKLIQDPDAPAWNYEVGDRVVRADLAAVAALRSELRRGRPRGGPCPPAALRRRIAALRRTVPDVERRIPAGLDLAREWASIPTVNREDLATRVDAFVPVDADLARLIVYDTSGTTGHAIRVPHHPCAMAQNHALLEYVLARHGVRPRFRAGSVACINVGAQVSTVVFATTFSAWGGAAFAKVNLHPKAWSPGAAARFFARHPPQFLTGDPCAFDELMAWKVPVRPVALVSTAAALSPALRRRLARRYDCPVIDSYATTETGVIGYTDPAGNGFRILPPDIFVEIVDADGRPVPEGRFGEICVSGGRNPYLPLLRYRTGDFGRLRWTGLDRPYLLDLQAREPVTFRAADGSPVSPVDIGRLLRNLPVVASEFVQTEDGSCHCALRFPDRVRTDTGHLRVALRGLFGTGVNIRLRLDPSLGRDGRKIVPFRRTR